MLLKRNRLVFVFSLVLLLLGVGFFSYFFFLPNYIEKLILPDLGRQLSSTLGGRVHRIGFSSADFGEIILGDTVNPALRLGSVHVDYSFSLMRGKRLRQVKVDGFFLQLNILDGRLILPGIDLDAQGPSQADTEQKSSQEIKLPFTLGRLQINNGIIAVNYSGKRMLVPFDLQVNRMPGSGEPAEYGLQIQMNPQDGQVTIKGTIDLSGNRSTLALAADSLDLDRFAHFADREGNKIHLGKVSINGEAEIAMLPFQLVSANLSVDPELLYI